MTAFNPACVVLLTLCLCSRKDPAYSCVIVLEGGLFRSQKPGPAEPRTLTPVDTRNAGTAFKHAAVSFAKLALLVRCSSDISKNKLLGLPLALVAGSMQVKWESRLQALRQLKQREVSHGNRQLLGQASLDSLQSFFVVLLTLCACGRPTEIQALKLVENRACCDSLQSRRCFLENASTVIS